MGQDTTGRTGQSPLGPSDAFTLNMERDPTLRSTIVAVWWLDQAPAWDRFEARLAHAVDAIGSFRARLRLPANGLGVPQWVPDPSFELSRHLERVGVPPPYTRQVVIDQARRGAAATFDPVHPLWHMTLMEGLDDGSAALVMRLHHALTDGMGAMALLTELFDVNPDVDATPIPADVVPDAGRGWWAPMEGTARWLAAAVPATVQALVHPARTVSEVVDTVRSLGRTVTPVVHRLSPVMSERGLRRHLEMLAVDLGDLKRAAKAADGTVNDAFLAAVTGGLRRYHHCHGAAVEELRVTLPISLRTDRDPAGGNHIGLERFALPVADPDPARRMVLIGERCRAARHEPALRYTDAVARALNLLPPAVVGGLLKQVDFVASNVPGPPTPIYLTGTKVTGAYAFGPTIGAAVNVTLMSYDGVCHVGVTVDVDAVGDPDLLVACLRDGFEEVLALGGAHHRARLPQRDDPDDPPDD